MRPQEIEMIFYKKSRNFLFSKKLSKCYKIGILFL